MPAHENTPADPPSPDSFHTDRNEEPYLKTWLLGAALLAGLGSYGGAQILRLDLRRWSK
ncbi:MAG: hypothetical protein R3F17_08445 [Planctomycetota bacterium]